MSETAVNLPSNDPERDSQSRAALSVVQTTGSMLQVARQAAGLSINDVSDQLKLSIRQINALENNQFDQLPTMVHVRGFVRSYAKLLKIDSEPLIALLPNPNATPDLAQELRPSLDTPFMESRTSFLTRQDQPNRLYIAGTLVLLLAVGGFVAFQNIERPVWLSNLLDRPSVEAVDEAPTAVSNSTPELASPSVTASMADSDHSASTVTLPNPVASSEASLAGTASVTVASLPATVSVGAGTSASQVSVNSMTTASVASAVQSKNEPVSKALNNFLVLKFTADSWLQVKTDSGKVLRSYLVRAGAEERIEVTEGLQVKLGNATGVQAWLRGSVLDVTPPNDTNVSNFNVK